MSTIQEIGSVSDRINYLFNNSMEIDHSAINRGLIRVLLLDESHIHIIIDNLRWDNSVYTNSIIHLLLEEFEKFTIVDMKRNIVICIDDILKPIDKKCIEDLDIENIYR